MNPATDVGKKDLNPGIRNSLHTLCRALKYSALNRCGLVSRSVSEVYSDCNYLGFHLILLQGETLVGKTSLITWLSRSSGNVCVRINNHEHTDLQECIGCYAADETGKEGVLVEAMR
ncbi:hypothetical protein ScPMuIL_009360 [Solemya velum]